MTEQTMIERVARAMVVKDSGPEGSALFDVHWREFGDGYLSGARAAIAAMREPRAIMVDAATAAISGYPPNMPDHDYDEDFIALWQAAIDAALNEPQP